MGKEDCPDREECDIHYRNDSELVDIGTERVRIVSYHGDYAVVTNTYPFALRGVFGQLLSREYKDRFDTAVYHVGSGVLADVGPSGTVFHETHDSLDNVIDAHGLVVSAVKQGWLVAR